ncbi:MAG: T9SS type A sorting domain-containing protein [Bacteroidetes bacterium]|nr:T9SS type A sorting domain-containing protein [Bacteroidota bacterium]
MKLRRTIFGAVAGAALVALASTGAVAQIDEEYTISIQPRFYQPQTNQGIQITRSQFHDNFAPGVVDPDNGTTNAIPIGFPVQFDNQEYTQFYVSVNGWVSFLNPGAFITDDPYALFNDAPPNETLAPFFGDHYLRTPGFDDTDPQGRFYTPSTIRYVSLPPDTAGRSTLIVEWEDLNINYRFDPTQPDNPYAPVANVKPQAPSVGSFQLWIIQASPTASVQQPRIEFHYGPVGPHPPIPFPDTVGSVVKTSGASVGIEGRPGVNGGQPSFLNGVAYAEYSGSPYRLDSTKRSRRLTRVWPPTDNPGLAFVFEPNGVGRIRDWGDGDADLSQLDNTLPAYIREDQRRFVSFLDVIRILRHDASRTTVPFDYSFGRHGYHGDVNHNGRFYFSTRNSTNTADSLDSFGRVVRYQVKYPIKSSDYQTPFPNDNSFNGFLFDADAFDASLIMLYLAAKLPMLPWLPDTLPHFTGKFAPTNVASDIQLAHSTVTGTHTIEIPVTFNGYLSGAMGVGMEATNGTRIVRVETPEKTDNAWVEAVATDNRLALAAAGNFGPNDVIATLVVEANNDGDVTFNNIQVGADNKAMRKFNIFGATTGEANSVSLTQNFPNPFAPNSTTTLGYAVPADGNVVIRVYDVLGHEVKTLVNAEMKTGTYSVEWNGVDSFGKPVESGVYYCRIESNGQSRTTAMQVRK